MLDNGDMTEIGEKGINLSGGQKQRVSVARAAYSNADVVILDDPLSALDPEVGAKMFQQCIAGFMKGKTIFFVTNQLNFLQFCDHVIALGKHRVVEQGSASDLLSKSGGEVKRLLDELRASQPSAEKGQGSGEPGPAGSDPEKGAQASPDDTPKEAKSNAVLLTKEERRVGAVSLSVYKEYVKAGGGYFRFMGVYAVMLLVTGAKKLHNEGFYTTLFAVHSHILKSNRKQPRGELLGVVLDLGSFVRGQRQGFLPRHLLHVRGNSWLFLLC